MDSAVHRLPVLAETGIRKFYNGPESFTPDNQFIIGEAPELRRLLRRGRLQLGGDRVGGRCRSCARGVDRRGRADDRPDQRRHPQVLAAGGQQRLAAPAGGRGAGAALRRAVAQPRARDGAAAAAFARARPGRRAGRLPGQSKQLGAPQCLCAPGCSARHRVLVGAPDLGRLVGRGAAWRRGRRSRSSTRRRSRSTSSSGPDAERALQWVCTADVGVPEGRSVYTGMLNARGTYESDVTVTRMPPTSSSSSAARRRRCATSTGCVATSRRTRRRTSSTSRARMPCSASWGRGPASSCSGCRPTPFDDASFPFATSREVRIGPGHGAGDADHLCR